MQTNLPDFIRNTPTGREADAILRTCVHCGMCNATCPTYQLLGDELDGPRGRIYLIKEMLEGRPVSGHTLVHLDRCLTCRNCETTCPSGVRYGALVDLGREIAEQRIGRPLFQRLARWGLRQILPYRSRFTPLFRIGQILRPVLPSGLKRQVPARHDPGSRPAARHARRMLVLEGCVQPALAPQINAATARLLDRLGISLVTAAGAGCCGAASHHTSGGAGSLDFARRNIDAWWPHIQQGVEAIVMTASGCGVHVKDYGHLLRHDAAYAEKAHRVSELTRDLSEIVAREDCSRLAPAHARGTRLAFQSPCTLQHGQRLGGAVEQILREAGYALTAVPEGHLCCGSAGTYSILQPELSNRLRDRKLANLASGAPTLIATANIGCLMHLQAATTLPVRHWVELLAAGNPEPSM